MTPRFSIWLDVLRAAAALVVLFGHLAHTRFTGGNYAFLRDINIASDAVVVFFVLSGLVIAYAAERDGSLEKFAFNRVTRIATVLIPALILTRLFDGWGTGTDMSAYPTLYYGALDAPTFWGRGLTLTNEWQGFSDRVRLGTNGPLWSLSYEATYYAIFGIFTFLSGLWRSCLIIVICAFAGVPILALFPAWLLGAWVWRRISEGRAAGLSTRMASIYMILPPVCLVVFRLTGLPEFLSLLTQYALLPISHHALLGYSDEIIWNMLIALATALHLIGVAGLVKPGPANENTMAIRAVRWFAGGSFSIYVMHYPTLHLLDAILPQTLPGYHLILLFGTLTICLGFAAVFERPLKWYRARVHGAVLWMRAQPS